MPPLSKLPFATPECCMAHYMFDKCYFFFPTFLFTGNPSSCRRMPTLLFNELNIPCKVPPPSFNNGFIYTTMSQARNLSVIVNPPVSFAKFHPDPNSWCFPDYFLFSSGWLTHPKSLPVVVQTPVCPTKTAPRSLCYELNCIPPKYVEVVTSRTCECDLIWI